MVYQAISKTLPKPSGHHTTAPERQEDGDTCLALTPQWIRPIGHQPNDAERMQQTLRAKPCRHAPKLFLQNVLQHGAEVFVYKRPIPAR